MNLVLIDFVHSESQTLLIQMEDAAKAAGKGKWSLPEEAANHVRDIKWQVENIRHFVESNKNKEIDGMLYILLYFLYIILLVFECNIFSFSNVVIVCLGS